MSYLWSGLVLLALSANTLAASIRYRIQGSGITAGSFDYESDKSGGAGTWHSAAHIEGLALPAVWTLARGRRVRGPSR